MPRPPTVQKKIKKAISRNYVSKDFDAFKAELLQHARTFFPDKISDFSEVSLGGLFLDFAATVGDSMTFFLDHQFNELNPLTAVEPDNIINHLKNAGVKIVGASPAVAEVYFSIDVPAETIADSQVRPKRSSLPTIAENSVFLSSAGVKFTLTEDVNFALTTFDNKLIASVAVISVNSVGLPSMYRLTSRGICVSGKLTVDSFSLGTTHVPFRSITLIQPNISEIMSVIDTEGNQYYEVESLTNDVVFGGATTIDTRTDETVEQEIQFIPAPRRYIKKINPLSGLTTITFGSGIGDTFDDDIIPDPAELAIPLYGKKTFSRFTLDPNKLLQSSTLGVSPKNTVLTIGYRYGGGLSHNVDSDTINTVDEIRITYPNATIGSNLSAITTSLSLTNPSPANGGLPAPTLEDLRAAINSSRQSQDRIVSKADALARLYTIPSKFGRAYRAAIVPNISNPLSTNLHIISMDSNGYLIQSSDALKKNINRYFNEFRLISDAVDVLDTNIINFGISFKIVAHPNSNKTLVLQSTIARLIQQLTITNFQIGQPIVLGDLINIIINTSGVVSISEMPTVTNKVGSVPGSHKKYSPVSYSPGSNTVRGLVICPSNAIFELKYPNDDIIGTVA